MALSSPSEASAGQSDHATARDALEWMRGRSGNKQVLFRGQNRIYPTVRPSLVRENIEECDRMSWWAVLRRFVASRGGLTGYQLQPHDAVAVVQHYLVKSPVIDVTGTPEIALYFALMNAGSEQERVVYAVTAEAVEAAGLVVTDHDFLALPFDDGGRMHRWLRQDGFTIGAKDWFDLDRVRELDFARVPGVESFTFRPRPNEFRYAQELGDLETVNGDPLAGKVRAVFEIIAREFGCLDSVRRLLPAAGTVDSRGTLIGEIKDLLERAQRTKMPSGNVASIGALLADAHNDCWDTAHSAALDYWAERVNSSR
jgi:hypothetical protein